MRSISIFAITTLVLLAASGCAPSIAGGPTLTGYQAKTQAYFDHGFSADSLDEYRKASTSSSKLIARNAVVLSAMGQIDLAYTKFAARLTREAQTVPFLATVTSISLSGAGTLVGSSVAKTTLAAVDTGIKGGMAAYDKNILGEKTIQFLQKQMQSNRNKMRSVILSKLSLDTLSYPLELAMLDVNDYATAGTVTQGLIGIDEQTSRVLAQTQEEKVETIFAYGADDATLAIEAYVKAKGAPAETALAAWVKSLNTDRTEFLYSGKYALSRIDFMMKNGIPKLG
jgi:hypothetical protein